VGISDLILTILVLAAIAFAAWVFDLNPYSKQFQLYSQTCDNMILDNSYCKGSWQDNPIETFLINQKSNQITHTVNKLTDHIVYDDCIIENSQNWQCVNQTTQTNIAVKDGQFIYAEKSHVQQISRLEWLQNKFLKMID